VGLVAVQLLGNSLAQPYPSIQTKLASLLQYSD